MEISIAAEKYFEWAGFPVTNTVVTTLLVVILLIVSLSLLSRRLQLVPRGFQNVVETIFEAFMNLSTDIMGDRETGRKFFPLAVTIFFFILISNWMGLLPGMGTVGWSAVHEGHPTIIPFIRSASADLNMTIALSLVSVFTIQFAGIAALGLRGYAAKFFASPFHKPYILGTVMGLLEMVSEVAKLLSFSFRLFGNVFAGEVLLTVMLHLVPYFVPLPFLFLEIFVGFIQAAVFAMLTLVFIKMARTEASH
jgi:F-type H+-transporting ATPase subunit a